MLHFRHKCDCEPDDAIYFAFAYPHSYTECMARFARLDALFGLPSAQVLPPDTAGGASTAASPLGSCKDASTWAAAADACASGPCTLDAANAIAAAAATAAMAAAPPARPHGIYYHRELLMRSLNRRRIDLITISGTNRMLGDAEGALNEVRHRPSIVTSQRPCDLWCLAIQPTARKKCR